MGIILSKFTIGGIKNLEKPITIEFMNYKNDQNDGSRYTNINSYKNVTAIYGPNGTGKSAIIHGIEILSQLLETKNFLIKEDKYISALINNKTNAIILEIDFYIIKNGFETPKPIQYRYAINMKRNETIPWEIEIIKEELLQLKPFKKIILNILNGEIKTSNISKSLLENFRGKILNRSFFDVFLFDVFSKIEKENLEEFVETVNPFLTLSNSLNFYLEETDLHSKYRIKFETIRNQMMHINTNTNIEITNIIESIDGDIVSLKDINKYEENVKNLTKFIKLFKPDLLDIEIEKRLDANNYKINLKFKYLGYAIDKDLESVGIKKLCKLFNSFRNLQQGTILFIDELDSAINDVYLLKIIEYFADYCKGQIIFTTHNTTPMDVMNNNIRKNKCQICFLDNNNNLNIWKNIGSFSPSSLYKKGQIKGLPFSIESYDFIDLFKQDDN